MAGVTTAQSSDSAVRPPRRFVTSARRALTGPGHPSHTLWRAIMLVALVAAISTGILAMHSFSAPVSSTETTTTAEHSAVMVESSAAVNSPPGDCAGCNEHLTMTAMWCLLALLTTTFVLLVPRFRVLRRRRLWRPRPLPAAHHRLVWHIPRPPSLHVLGISRR